MKERSKRIFSGATAIIAALAILTSGALAWYASTTATNMFSGTELKPMANLHDDFADPSAGGTIDKNVYVENTGNTNVYVRVMLTERIQFGEDTATTDVHIPEGTDVADCGTNHETFAWTMGNTDKGEYAYASIEDGVDWASLTPNQKAAKVADGLGSADTPAKVDLTGKAPNKTTSKTDVITMAAYTALGDADKADYVGWVYDVDGYAYWSQPLKEGEATGLLLSAVTVPEAGELDYKYDIIVNMEFVDITDIGAWIEGAEIKEGPQKGGTTTQATAEANELLKEIAGMNKSNIPTVAGSIYTDGDENDWIVLTTDEAGNVLITTVDMHSQTIFNPYTGGANDNKYVNSELETKMKTFTTSLADDLKDRVQGVDFKGEFDWYDGAPAGYGLSAVDNGADKTAFALSKQEVEAYIISNTEINNALGGDWYWLRTAHSGSENAAFVNPGHGVIDDYVVSLSLGLRPALWINTK